MRILLFVSVMCGLVALTAANKKCDSLEKKFKDCLSKGFKPKKLEGCKSGDGKMEKKDVKKCAKVEKVVIKKCDFSCDDEDGGDENGGDVREPFVPAAGSHYLVKKVDAPGAGQVLSISLIDKRNIISYFLSTAVHTSKGIPWTIEKAACSCQNECTCYKLVFRKKTCCCYRNFAMSVHSDTRDNGDGRVIVHRTPHKPEDESWVIEPAVNGYKLKKAQGRQEGKYLVARVNRKEPGTMFADVTADSSAASIWNFETIA